MNADNKIPSMNDLAINDIENEEYLETVKDD